ncbi:PTS glucose transporter subunit IIA [Clostridium sp. SYSU_GA19001]|uniref:PTS sugar transporter subunit IIA n=1 Tax=Clostridium caldaquaticum TaxID=2940653 RepID=UPI0020777C17|nr:PTS glucose transporter subunit IIA [Clostridium caldaquaticum]MCM8709649.1 PTS glucose transporter subunit IIA [Clostridium caldaquaticum]
MLEFFRKNYKLVAPVDGKVIDLTEVPDPVFAGKLVGDGIAIDSTGDIIVAPADGKLSVIFGTNHGFGIVLNNDAEVLVHIGLDTVALEGKGFERLVREGANVKAGDAVIKINREYIISEGYSLITLVLFTNLETLKDIYGNIGAKVKAGTDVILEYKLK